MEATAEGMFVLLCNFIRRGDFDSPIFVSLEKHDPTTAQAIRSARASLVANQKTYADYKANALKVHGEDWPDAEYIWLMTDPVFPMMLAVGDYAAAMDFISDNKHLLVEKE